MVFRNQDLGFRCVHCYRSVIYIHTHIYYFSCVHTDVDLSFIFDLSNSYLRHKVFFTFTYFVFAFHFFYSEVFLNISGI